MKLANPADPCQYKRMSEALLILLTAALTNNFVLVKFLGLCPFMGISDKQESSYGIALATTFVLTLTSVLTYLVYYYALRPLHLEYLRTFIFIILIAAIVQWLELLLRHRVPLMHRTLGIYLPLITTNCAVLGMNLLNIDQRYSLLSALCYGIGAGLGFSLVLLLFAAIRARLVEDKIPQAFRGPAIAFMTIGIMSMAFMGLAGLAR